MFEKGINTFQLELYNFYNKLSWKPENVMILGGARRKQYRQKKLMRKKVIIIKESTIKGSKYN